MAPLCLPAKTKRSEILGLMVGALAEVFGRSFTLHGRSFVAAPDSAEPSCGTLKAVCVRSVMCVYIGILVCFSVYTDRCYSSSLLLALLGSLILLQKKSKPGDEFWVLLRDCGF